MQYNIIVGNFLQSIWLHYFAKIKVGYHEKPDDI